LTIGRQIAAIHAATDTKVTGESINSGRWLPELPRPA
jgi:hypothetical protein